MLADNAALGASLRELLRQLAEVNFWLDSDMTAEYAAQPLAHRWARVTKVCSEAGEVMDALSATTGENRRKGVCGTDDDLRRELGDVCSAALLALQHETGDAAATWGYLVDACARAHSRIGTVPEPKVKVTAAQLRNVIDELIDEPGWTLSSRRELAERLFAALGGVR
jgi:NTP pyrophosphatase (non-canonical NTP hydrolase)